MTGYTAGIKEDTTLEEFVLRCARAMLASMRDQDADVPIPERFEPSDYSAKALDKARAEMARLAVMGWGETEVEAAKANQARRAEWERSKAEKVARKVRYERMMSLVCAWDPPTRDHGSLKEFMFEQITSSIDHDCGWPDGPAPEPERPGDWLFARIESVRKDIEHYAKSHGEEVARVESQNAWLSQLRQSFVPALGGDRGTP